MDKTLKSALAQKNRKEPPCILIAAAECSPFAKTGGLADVIGTLPRALRSLGFDARVILPCHRVIRQNYGDQFRHYGSITVNLGWRKQYAGIEMLESDGLRIYLIDNEFYFGDRIYRGGDAEGEQYAFFQRAVLEALPLLDFNPEIIHCNDWHTAIIPMLIKTQYAGKPQGRLRTLLTIHNLAYQGKFSYESARDLLNIDPGLCNAEGIGHGGSANFLKTGIVYADAVGTVSPSYAREILTPEYGEGLDTVLSGIGDRLRGIINGIDTKSFDPRHDKALAAHYSAGDAKGKLVCKRALMRELGLDGGNDTPLVAMVTRMTPQKGFDLIKGAMSEIMKEGVCFVLLGTGDRVYEDFMRASEACWRGKLCSYIGYSDELARRIYAGADIFLMPSLFEPCGISQMIAMRYGALPVVRETGGLRDTVIPYNKFTGEGTGFSFRNFSAWEMTDALRRATRLYRGNRGAFHSLVRNAMAQDFSFDKSAREYTSLFIELCGEDPNAMAVPAHFPADERCRSPIGALRCGEDVTLTVSGAGGAAKAVLEIWGENFDLSLGMDAGNGGFSAAFQAPEEPVALRYAFRLDSENGACWLGDAGAISAERPEGFRLTVFAKDFKTPDWAKKAVMYQIFPDRFAPGGGSAEAGIAYHRKMGRAVFLHEAWDEPVTWRGEDGKEYFPNDFYGGTFSGIAGKLPELKELGVTCIYLNPVCESASNHRYDTADYRKADPVLGTNADFAALCDKASRLGIKIIFDGVYSHTGSDSIYFNREGRYKGPGAFESTESPYRSWYDFGENPGSYRRWWGFDNLPEVREEDPGWRDFVITGADSVIKTWLKRGAYGLRLDVADELPDSVIELIRGAVKGEKPGALVIGEVWEDAVTKISGGGIRRYALGTALDSVMNYPLRLAALDFLTGKTDARALAGFLLGQRLHYPEPMYYCLMNHMGTHDTERLLTALSSGGLDFRAMSREEQAEFSLAEGELLRGAALQRLCAALQFSLPGIPSIYYGDEEGMTGALDPFNRAPYRRNGGGTRDFYASFAALRNASDAMKTGSAAFFAPDPDVLCVLRCICSGEDVFGAKAENGVFLAVINRSENERGLALDIFSPGRGLTEAELNGLRGYMLSGCPSSTSEAEASVTDGLVSAKLPPLSASLFRLG